MNRNEATPIPGTEGAFGPFFSPDGEWVGFFADNELKKVGLSGSLPVVLGAARSVHGASWSSSGEILSSVRDGGAVVRTPALGGTPESVQFSDEIVPRWPWVLPGGRAFLASYNSEKIVAVSLDSGDFAVLLEGGDDPRYLPTGHLVFQRQGQLFAVPFDPDGLKLTGTPVPVLDGAFASRSLAAPSTRSQTTVRSSTLQAVPSARGRSFGSTAKATRSTAVSLGRFCSVQNLSAERPASYWRPEHHVGPFGLRFEPRNALSPRSKRKESGMVARRRRDCVREQEPIGFIPNCR
jgi:hypothetical protein